MQERKIGTISLDVVTRLLECLDRDGPASKTNLARKTGLNYDSCARYIEILGILGWLETRCYDRGYAVVFISESGRRINAKLLDASERFLIASIARTSSTARHYDKAKSLEKEFHEGSATDARLHSSQKIINPTRV